MRRRARPRASHDAASESRLTPWSSIASLTVRPAAARTGSHAASSGAPAPSSSVTANSHHGNAWLSMRRFSSSAVRPMKALPAARPSGSPTSTATKPSTPTRPRYSAEICRDPAPMAFMIAICRTCWASSPPTMVAVSTAPSASASRLKISSITSTPFICAWCGCSFGGGMRTSCTTWPCVPSQPTSSRVWRSIARASSAPSLTTIFSRSSGTASPSCASVCGVT